MERNVVSLAQALTISVGESRNSRRWTPKRMTWASLCEKMRVPMRTKETADEFARMTRDERAEIKDVGGFVGGRLMDGSRKAGRVTDRQIICLDADFGYADLWDSWDVIVGRAALMHSTHSHTPQAPRLRFLIPLSRPVSAEEYMPIARRLAELMDIEAFDDTTYEANRLMYWPSCPSDGEYIFEEMSGPWVDPDEMLATYDDWHDMRQWPRSSRQQKAIKKMGEKQGDPLQKPGIIGAFNRAYTITEAIQKFLSDRYEPCGAGRWTYLAGSTMGGAVSYDDDTFLFSHHDTDPTSGRLCSAYDLVRIHLYGDLDAGMEDADPPELPSTAKMKVLCAEDEAVRAELAESIRRDPAAAFDQMDDLERFNDDLTEQGLAASFIDRYGSHLRYNKAFGWMVWSGEKWNLDTDAEAGMLVMHFADEVYGLARTKMLSAEDKPAQERAKALLKAAVKLRSANGNKAMLKLVKDIVTDPNAGSYDAAAWDLNTPEGIIDLKTGNLRPHDPLAKCTKITAVSVGDDGADLWGSFLRHITGGDTEFETYLQVLAGMAAVGEVYEEGLVIVHGNGGNGKSTLFGALRKVLGDYARGINADVLVSQNSRTDQSYVAALRGARLAIMGETEEGAHLSLAQMKRLTSRDVISARALYKDPIEFLPTHTIVMHTNHLPRTSSLDGGTKRRIAVAPFPATLPPEKVITNYEAVLVREAGPAILKWIVDGAKKFYETGCKLHKPKCVNAATSKYMVGEDWLLQFISECCETGADYSIKGGELYAVYANWTKAMGEYVRRNRDFAYALAAQGYEKVRKNDGAHWHGLRLREEL